MTRLALGANCGRRGAKGLRAARSPALLFEPRVARAIAPRLNWLALARKLRRVICRRCSKFGFMVSLKFRRGSAAHFRQRSRRRVLQHRFFLVLDRPFLSPYPAWQYSPFSPGRKSSRGVSIRLDVVAERGRGEIHGAIYLPWNRSRLRCVCQALERLRQRRDRSW